MESKKEIYDSIPQQFYPHTILIQKNSKATDFESLLTNHSINYPCIAKPDIGLRGSAVKKIHSLAELKNYAQKADFDFLVQNLIPFPNEIGIFYVRFPNQAQGRITGIVSKEFLTIVGNGKDTIEALLNQNPRYALQLKVLKKEYGLKLSEVLPQAQKVNLVPYGNHARGAKFIDGSAWITPQLEKTIDAVCAQIPHFYFGRLDVMFDSIEKLEKGEDFSIVELNGAGSEPTHIYDPKHSLFFAWKELARHITYMYKISAINKKNGFEYLTFRQGAKELKLHFEQSRKIVNF